MSTDFQTIPNAPNYQINSLAAVRNAKTKTPVFSNDNHEVSLKTEGDSRVTINVVELTKELFGVDVKPKDGKYAQIKARKVKVQKEPKVKKENKEQSNEVKITEVVNCEFKEGDEVKFTPKTKKHREGEGQLSGIILKVFKGGDGNVYAKIKVGDKSFMKQVKSISK